MCQVIYTPLPLHDSNLPPLRESKSFSTLASLVRYHYLVPVNIYRIKFFIVSALIILTAQGCKPRHIPKHEIISFKSIFGIHYIEVSRRLQNGLEFNEYGYQLEPQWELTFLKNDSTQIYSPIKNAFINFPLSRGYDSIFNTARTWYKVRKMNTDSLVFEILKFTGDSINITGNKVFMTFYSDKHIRALHTDTATLRRPTGRDTAFIKTLVAKSEVDINQAFAARQPVEIISTNPDITVEKFKTEATLLNHFDTSDDYFDPEFYILIKNAYQDFSYSFTAYVDDEGRVTFGVPLIVFSDSGYEAKFIKQCNQLINGYMKLYLKIKPGSTLGMVHASKISLHVKGRTRR